MSVIVPTILTETPEDYKVMVAKFHPFASRVQIDITDGEFATNKTVSLDQVWWPEDWAVDIHMMVKRPSEFVEQLLKLHPNLVIFHVEADEDLTPALNFLKQASIKTGVAFLKPSFPGKYKEYLDIADHALIFSGDLGSYGGAADLLQAEKAHIIKGLKPTIEVGWDGGANEENVFMITKAGVDVINVGGALASVDDIKSAYDVLVNEATREGTI
ncbi:MAG: hypothetical protein LBE03_02120 [Candidatus Nomurabacteria bacterium]|jgi:pentose-5-phosphate-3-epimerase|nr:hypothetical protein [Candidatus Nomurabacteria bacterium]